MRKIKRRGITYRYQEPKDIVKLAKLLVEVSNEDAPISAKRLDMLSAINNFVKMQNRMKSKAAVSIVAQIDDEIVGNAAIRSNKGRLKAVGEIGIIVKKEYRNKKIGTNLMKILLKEAKKIGIKIALLQVVSDNKPAIRVYEKLKFKKMGILPKCFDSNGRMKDVIYMYRRL